MGAVRHAFVQHGSARQVRGGDGRPAVGHPHGAAVWHAFRRRDEEPQRAYPSGSRLHLPLGHWQVASHALFFCT